MKSALTLLVASVLLVPGLSWACRCDFGPRDEMLKQPATASTAIVGRVEAAGGKSVIRVVKSWTGFRSVFDDAESSTCALRLEPGHSYLILSIDSADVIERRGMGFTICDSVAREVSKAGDLVGALLGANSPNGSSPNPSWSYCSDSAECVAENGVCSGQTAVNRKYSETYRDWVRKVAPTVNCVSTGEARRATRFDCAASFCAVAQWEKVAAPPAGPVQTPSKDPCGAFDEKWTACKADSDCAVMLNACGALSAYNRDTLGPVARYNKCEQPMIKCADPGNPDATKATASCQDGKCAAKNP